MKATDIESDKPVMLRISVIVILSALLVMGIASFVVYYEYVGQFDRTSMYLDHKTMDLDADSALEHWITTYDREPVDKPSFFHEAVAEYPEGTLFHYKSSAQEGYAIVDRGKIVWKGATIKY